MQQSEREPRYRPKPEKSGEPVGHHPGREQQDAERAQEPDREHERVVAEIGPESKPEGIAYRVLSDDQPFIEPGRNERISRIRVGVSTHEHHWNETSRDQPQKRRPIFRNATKTLNSGVAKQWYRE